MPLSFRTVAYVGQRFLLGRRLLTASIPEFGLIMRVASRDVVGRHLYKYGVHEPVLSRFVTEHLDLRPGDVVLDVGSNIGWYSLLLSRHVRAGVQIFAFEPAPANYALLTENLRRNGASSVTAIQAAVGAAPGRASLHLYSESNRGRHSLLPINEGPTVDVDVICLDDFCREQGISRRPIGFLKLDIEGYEVFALKGANETLKRCRAILTEYSPAFMAAAGIEPTALLDMLASAGFQPHFVSESGPQPADLNALRRSNEQTDLFWLPVDRPKPTQKDASTTLGIPTPRLWSADVPTVPAGGTI